MAEVPWFTEPPAAALRWDEHDDEGYLRFVGPDGDRAVIAVTHGPDRHDHELARNIWHIDVAGDVATVSPSVHFVDHWHSPNPATFRLVDDEQLGWG